MPTDRFVLGPAELVRVQLAVSPGNEMARVVRRLCHRPDLPLHTALLARIRVGVPDQALRTLAQVVPARGYTPDFVCQPAAETAAEVVDGIRRASVDLVRLELCRARDEASLPVPDRWLADPGVARQELADAWEGIWLGGLQHEWPRLERVLLADIASRSRRLASDGLGAVLEGLQDNVGWDGEAVVRRDSRWGVHVDCTGRGLRLVPSIFAWPRGAITTDRPWPPTIFYPARHATVLPGEQEPPEAVSRLLGRTRALVLAHLVVPARTTDVATGLGISLATASHHLGILRDAGLVVTTRDGTQAWHSRTAMTDDLGW